MVSISGFLKRYFKYLLLKVGVVDLRTLIKELSKHRILDLILRWCKRVGVLSGNPGSIVREGLL